MQITNDTSGTKLHTGSGLTGTADVTEVFSSSTGHLTVTFKSNLVLVEKGFMAEFSVGKPDKFQNIQAENIKHLLSGKMKKQPIFYLQLNFTLNIVHILY